MRTTLRWYQWRLRTLLAVMTLAALGAAGVSWWFQPFVVETRRSDGSLRTRFDVRRDWRGQTVACGRLEWFFADGTKVTRRAHGIPLDDSEFVSALSHDDDFDILIWHIAETIVPGCTILVAESAADPATATGASPPCFSID